MRQTIVTENARISYMTKDAVFTLGGRKISMEFHSYCGPSFWFNYGREDEREFCDWYEFPELVSQFDSWWAKKGVGVYG